MPEEQLFLRLFLHDAPYSNHLQSFLLPLESREQVVLEERLRPQLVLYDVTYSTIREHASVALLQSFLLLESLSQVLLKERSLQQLTDVELLRP